MARVKRARCGRNISQIWQTLDGQSYCPHCFSWVKDSMRRDPLEEARELVQDGKAIVISSQAIEREE